MSKDQVNTEEQKPQDPHRFILDFGSSMATLDIKSNVITFVSPSGVLNGTTYIPPSSFSIGDAMNLSLLRDVINRYYPSNNVSEGPADANKRDERLIAIINDQQASIMLLSKESEDSRLELNGVMSSLNNVLHENRVQRKEIEELRLALSGKDQEISKALDWARSIELDIEKKEQAICDMRVAHASDITAKDYELTKRDDHIRTLERRIDASNEELFRLRNK